MSDPSSPESSATPASGSSFEQPIPQPALVRRWKSVLSALLAFAAGLTIGVCIGLFSRPLPPRPSSSTLRAHKVSIRVQNRSSVDFRKVLVNDESFGDIRSGESSASHSMQHMYWYAKVSVQTPSGPMGIMPADFFGERELPEDTTYTYVLTIEHGKLVMECVLTPWS